MTYLHHRWAIDSGVRYIGGMYHNYVVKGDKLRSTEIVPAAFQRDILGLLITAIQPENLDDSRVFAWRRLPPIHTAVGAASSAAPAHPRASKSSSRDGLRLRSSFRRADAGGYGDRPDPAIRRKPARLISFADRQENALTLPETISKILEATWGAPRDATPMTRSLRRVSRQVALD